MYSNSENVIGNSNLPRINVHTKSSFNELVAFQKETDTESSTSINKENMDDNNASEELESHQNSTGVIYHTCDDNGINLLNTEEEVDVTYINSINETYDISMKDDDNFTHHYYYAKFLSSMNHEDVSSGSEYVPAKRRVRHNKNIILDLLLNKSKIFQWQISLLLLFSTARNVSTYGSD